MKRVVFSVLAAILFAVSPIHRSDAAASDPPPALVLISTITKLEPNAGTMVLVVRHDDAAGKVVSLRAPAGARLWQVGADGDCSSSGEQKASLDLAPDSANPAFVCFSMSTPVESVRVVATVSAGNAIYSASSEPFEIAEPETKSIWDTPGVSVILSALVGFLFGLGSSWFQVWFDAWKAARSARTGAQKFIAETLFPEFREHASAIKKYLAADAAELRNLCTKNLKVPAIAAAVWGDHLSTLTSYFASVSHGKLESEFSEYDVNLTAFNRWADRLRNDQPEDRQPGEQKLIADKLRKSLERWKLA